jgi:predicted deacylase
VDLTNTTYLPAIRSLERVVAPLDSIAAKSPHFAALTVSFNRDGTSWRMPIYKFTGPSGGDEPTRVGIFAGLHGDEPATTYGVVRFLTLLDQMPELATGYELFLYPVCNPNGFERGTRNSASGKDLNREFWIGSTEPEIRILQKELTRRRFNGLIALHSDDTSPGLYGFVSGATLTRHLLQPALAAAEELLPLNSGEQIDGFLACDGIIEQCYPGVLSAPSGRGPRPFEIIFETPGQAPQFIQEKALVVALQTVLSEYRKLLAYAPNL